MSVAKVATTANSEATSTGAHSPVHNRITTVAPGGVDGLRTARRTSRVPYLLIQATGYWGIDTQTRYTHHVRRKKHPRTNAPYGWNVQQIHWHDLPA